jgi:phosphate transport system substrate-binding protein
MLIRNRTLLKLLICLPLAIAPILTAPHVQASDDIDLGLDASAPTATNPLVVRLGATDETAAVNNRLQNLLAEQLPNLRLNISSQSANAVMQALLSKALDIGAIARPLTAAEQAQGLVAVPISDSLTYVYHGPEPNMAARYILSFVTNPANQDDLIAAAADPSETASASTSVGQLGASDDSRITGLPEASSPSSGDANEDDSSAPTTQPDDSESDDTTPPISAAVEADSDQAAEDDRAIASQSPTTISPNLSINSIDSPSPGETTTDGGAHDATTTEADGSVWWWLLPLLIGIPLVIWLIKGRKPSPSSSQSSETASTSLESVSPNDRSAPEPFVPPPTVEPETTSLASAPSPLPSPLIDISSETVSADAEDRPDEAPESVAFQPESGSDETSDLEIPEGSWSQSTNLGTVSGLAAGTAAVTPLSDDSSDEIALESVQKEGECDLAPDELDTETASTESIKAEPIDAENTTHAAVDAAEQVEPDISVDQTPVDQTPVDQTPVDQTPPDEISDEETPITPAEAAISEAEQAADFEIDADLADSSQTLAGLGSTIDATAAVDTVAEPMIVTEPEVASETAPVESEAVETISPESTLQPTTHEADSTSDKTATEKDSSRDTELESSTTEEPPANGVLEGLATAGAIAATGAILRELTTPVDAASDDISQSDQAPISLSDLPIYLTLAPQDQGALIVQLEMSDETRQALQTADVPLKLRLYDATAIDLDSQPPHSVQDYAVDARDLEVQMSVPASDRDYVVEMGYETPDGIWSCLVRSLHARVSTPKPPKRLISPTLEYEAPTYSAMDFAEAAGQVPSLDNVLSVPPTDPSLLARTNQQVDEAVELPASDQLLSQPSETVAESLVETPIETIDAAVETDISESAEPPIDDAEAVSASAPDDIPTPPMERSAEITAEEFAPAAIDQELSDLDIPTSTIAAAAGMAIATGLAADALSHADVEQQQLAAIAEQTHLLLEATDAQHVYAQWHLPDNAGRILEQQGISSLIVRLHDATGLNLDYQAPHSTQEIVVEPQSQATLIALPEGDRDYVAELGVVATDGTWSRLGRSLHIRVPGLVAPVEPDTPTAEPVLETETEQIETPKLDAQQGDRSIAPHADERPVSVPTVSPVWQQTHCKTSLTINSREHCYRLDQNDMQALRSPLNTMVLTAGTYIICIEAGDFCYRQIDRSDAEPWIVLWLYGGRFINKQTNIEAHHTWVSLNGYSDVLTLDVVTPTTLCAVFLDTHRVDNTGQIKLVVMKDE